MDGILAERILMLCSHIRLLESEYSIHRDHNDIIVSFLKAIPSCELREYIRKYVDNRINQILIWREVTGSSLKEAVEKFPSK